MRRSVPLLLVALFAGACSETSGSLAVVGDEPVELEMFQEYVEAITGEPWQEAGAAVATPLLDELLDQEVVVVAASKHGHRVSLPLDPARRSRVVRTLLEETCGKPDPLPDDLVEREAARRGLASTPARARVRQLILPSREEADQARARLIAGEPFADLSASVSHAPNAATGGGTGVVDETSLPPEFADAIFALQPGETSEPVEGPSGWHIFQVVERSEAGALDRDELLRQVRLELEQRRSQAHLNDCLERLTDDVGVEVRPEMLWFRYDGRYADEHASS